MWTRWDASGRKRVHRGTCPQPFTAREVAYRAMAKHEEGGGKVERNPCGGNEATSGRGSAEGTAAGYTHASVVASAVAAAIRKVSQWVELAPHGDRGRLSLGACTISVSQADQARGHPEGAENQPGALLALDTKMRERGVGDQDLQRMEMKKQ